MGLPKFLSSVLGEVCDFLVLMGFVSACLLLGIYSAGANGDEASQKQPPPINRISEYLGAAGRPCAVTPCEGFYTLLPQP